MLAFGLLTLFAGLILSQVFGAPGVAGHFTSGFLIGLGGVMTIAGTIKGGRPAR